MIKVEVPAVDGIVGEKNLNDVPKVGGVYLLYSNRGELLYIGKAQNIKQRLTQHFNCHSSDNLQDAYHNISYATYFYSFDPVEREIYETYMINTMKPAWNVEKVFTYRTRRYEEHWYDPEELAEEKRIKEAEFKILKAKVKALG